MSSLVARLRAEAGNKFEDSLERLLDEAANRIEALENWAQLHRGDVMSLNTEVEQCRLENARPSLRN
jgi:ABC-type phosphate transport system auxiliary subunit